MAAAKLKETILVSFYTILFIEFRVYEAYSRSTCPLWFFTLLLRPDRHYLGRQRWDVTLFCNFVTPVTLFCLWVAWRLLTLLLCRAPCSAVDIVLIKWKDGMFCSLREAKFFMAEDTKVILVTLQGHTVSGLRTSIQTSWILTQSPVIFSCSFSTTILLNTHILTYKSPMIRLTFDITMWRASLICSPVKLMKIISKSNDLKANDSGIVIINIIPIFTNKELRHTEVK